MKVTLIRDMREKSYFVEVSRDQETDGAMLASIPIKLLLDTPFKLQWNSAASFATVAAWLTGIGLKPGSFRSIWEEEQ